MSWINSRLSENQSSNTYLCYINKKNQNKTSLINQKKLKFKKILKTKFPNRQNIFDRRKLRIKPKIIDHAKVFLCQRKANGGYFEYLLENKNTLHHFKPKSLELIWVQWRTHGQNSQPIAPFLFFLCLFSFLRYIWDRPIFFEIRNNRN